MRTRFFSRTGLIGLVGVCSMATSTRAMSLVGETVQTSSQVNWMTVFSRYDTIINPGAEIVHGDPNTFNWMKPGDSIDFQPYTNPRAPWKIDVELGADHGFTWDSSLVLTFTLPADIHFGAAAIVRADNINQIVVGKNANVMTVTIWDMWHVSQGDFGGGLEIIFNPVSPPCTGDGNCDGGIDWRDIDYLVAAQNNNITGWRALFPGTITPCEFSNNDTDGDGLVDWRDIDPFVALMNTSCGG